MSKDWYEDILAFHTKFKHHIEPFPRIPPAHVQKLRRKLIREEVNELLDGIDDDDLTKVADGGGDAVVVILGTMISYGVDLRPIWDAIQESNMAKSPEKRADGKTLKPVGWQPPRIKELLDKQRKVS